jgi:UDP:flavonoid glycosyltransferase YjiC (YdhE family)
MRALLTNFGSRGDFQPLMFLAQSMRSQGHDVLFAAPASNATMIRNSGFECACVGPDVSGIRDQINLTWTMQAECCDDPQRLFELLVPLQESFDEVFDGLCRCCQSQDVLISGAAQPLSRIVHETTGIPFVSVQVAHFGGTGGPALQQVGDRLINPFRRKLGLASVTDALIAGTNSPQLALYAMSRWLRPRPETWPRHYHLTGFFFGEEEWLPDKDLLAFVERGGPIAVVTFGSMVHGDQCELRHLVLDAIRQAGCGAILLGLGSTNGENGALPDVLCRDYIPHPWLLARAACVVLHGGAGTTAAMLRAGRPGIFVPHFYDQHYWAQLAYEKGCSVQPIPFPELTAKRLSAAIREAIDNPSLTAAAAVVARNLSTENGVSNACVLIENLVESIGLNQ